MPDPDDTSATFDFASEMESLTSEAERRLEETKGKAAASPTLAQTLQPLVTGIEALGRALEANSAKLQRIESAFLVQGEIPAVMAGVKESIDQKSYLNQQLFDALHAELKDYKDGFLLEVMQKPIILDLIALFDDLTDIHRRLTAFAHAGDTSAPSQNQDSKALQLSINLGHTLESLLEVLERMEVSKLPGSTGKQLDKALHRAVKLEITESAGEDGKITESLKPGFTWKTRLLRPEEVTIRKFKETGPTKLRPESSGTDS